MEIKKVGPENLNPAGDVAGIPAQKPEVDKNAPFDIDGTIKCKSFHLSFTPMSENSTAINGDLAGRSFNLEQNTYDNEIVIGGTIYNHDFNTNSDQIDNLNLRIVKTQNGWVCTGGTLDQSQHNPFDPCKNIEFGDFIVQDGSKIERQIQGNIRDRNGTQPFMINYNGDKSIDTGYGFINTSTPKKLDFPEIYNIIPALIYD